MPKGDFYYVYGDDTDMVEKKWLPDIQKRFPKAEFLRYDASIDDIRVGRLVTEYNTNDLFSEGKVIVIRNVDQTQSEPILVLAESITSNPIPGNALVLIGKSWNKTTKLGRLIKKSFIPREFSRPELKPFALLDSLNSKNSGKVILHSNKLFADEYNPLAMYSLLCGHFVLLRQVKERQGMSPENIARELRQHQFRIKKATVANRYWKLVEIDQALKDLKLLGKRLRSWQYDPQMLLQMFLIRVIL